MAAAHSLSDVADSRERQAVAAGLLFLLFFFSLSPHNASVGLKIAFPRSAISQSGGALSRAFSSFFPFPFFQAAVGLVSAMDDETVGDAFLSSFLSPSLLQEEMLQIIAAFPARKTIVFITHSKTRRSFPP